jgi:hypothetical protein
MGIGKIIAAALLALTCLAGTPAAPSQESERRDLSRYEQAERIFLRHWWGSMMDDEEGAKARVREFLWEKWRAKKLAHHSIVIGYTHGDSLTTNYYVEPDKEGRWRIAVETVSSCCSLEVMQAAMEGKKKEREEVTRIVGYYYIVSRVDAESGRPVPEKERRKPERYALLLQDGKPRERGEVAVVGSTLKL